MRTCTQPPTGRAGPARSEAPSRQLVHDRRPWGKPTAMSEREDDHTTAVEDQDELLDDNSEPPPPDDEGMLITYDTLESDDLTSDPLDTGYSPQERRPASEEYGVTPAEASRPEPLDARLAREEPETAPVDEYRAGRLVADEDSPSARRSYMARDVGRDGGAASAEEAAVHEIPDEDAEGLNDDFDEGAEAAPGEGGSYDY